MNCVSLIISTQYIISLFSYDQKLRYKDICSIEKTKDDETDANGVRIRVNSGEPIGVAASGSNHGNSAINGAKTYHEEYILAQFENRDEAFDKILSRWQAAGGVAVTDDGNSAARI